MYADPPFWHWRTKDVNIIYKSMKEFLKVAQNFAHFARGKYCIQVSLICGHIKEGQNDCLPQTTTIAYTSQQYQIYNLAPDTFVSSC